MPPTPSFCEKQNTDGIVPPHAQNVKNETFTKIKSRKTQAFVEQAEIFTNRYFFLAARGQLCYTEPVPTAGGVRLRRAVFYACPHIADSAKPRLSYDRRGAFAGFQCVSLYLRMPRTVLITPGSLKSFFVKISFTVFSVSV